MSDLSDWLKNASPDVQRLNSLLTQKRPLVVEHEAHDEMYTTIDNDAENANFSAKLPKTDPFTRRDLIVEQSIVDGLSPKHGESIVEWSGGLFKMVLFGERPMSANVFHAGVHHKKRSDETNRIKDLVQMALFNHGMTGKKVFNHVVSIQIGCYMVHPAYDTNNPYVKSFVDGLQKFVIKADDLRYVDYVLPFTKKVAIDPRVEIIIGKLPWREFLP